MTKRHPFAERATRGQAHLRLIATTDLHAHVYPYDYFADRPSDAVGLARAATLIAEARAEATNAVALDNGDFLQGNPLGDYIAYERGNLMGTPHPMLNAMAAAGIEATTLGNHEFNYGLDFLDGALDGSPIPVVSANSIVARGKTPGDDDTLLPPYCILSRSLTDGDGQHHPIRIGVIGFVPPQILQWDHHALAGQLEARDIVETAAARIPELRAAGAEIVVALAHTGIGPAEARPGLENAATVLGAVPGIDAILCGHTHKLFPSDDFTGHPGCDTEAGTLNGTPAVMPGFWGSHIGLIDLLLERTPEGWRRIDTRSELRAIATRDARGILQPATGSAPAVLDAARAAHEETLTYIRRPVGRLTGPIHSYFALVCDCPSVQIITAAQADYVAEMLQDTEHAQLPVLAAAGPFKAGGRGGPDYYTDIPAGGIALKNVADLYLYPNLVSALHITGATLREWLERAAVLYRQITPGQPDQMLIDPEAATYNFDVVSGVSYRIDLSQPARYDHSGRLIDPAAHRIRDLTRDGRAVGDDDEFILATNNYRAGGGGDYPGAGPGAIVLSGPDTARDVLLRYIHDHQVIQPRRIGNWSFVPMPGTTALFDTGPGARDRHLDVASPVIEPVGPAPGGFLRFRVRL